MVVPREGLFIRIAPVVDYGKILDRLLLRLLVQISHAAPLAEGLSGRHLLALLDLVIILAFIVDAHRDVNFL